LRTIATTTSWIRDGSKVERMLYTGNKSSSG
jgi:hypothetical protein